MKTDRDLWLGWMLRIADPVLESLQQRSLRSSMPLQAASPDRGLYSHLEALGRLLSGMAPWLELSSLQGEEERLRSRYAELAREAIDAATDPASPDYMNFSVGSQPIVDAAFLSHALIRAPHQLIDLLHPRVRSNLAACLKATRRALPGYNNWLLFAAMIEAALAKLGEEWDVMRVDYAIRKHEEWYLGDGVYGDGAEHHADYYNSYVIQPMLLDILYALQGSHWDAYAETALRRAIRYAAIQERSISPEGTYPVVGRSLSYRFGCFQTLAQIALLDALPPGIQAAQVRCALTAVIANQLEMPGTFAEDGGWLRVGFCGSQPDIAEAYISTGSLYLCSTVFLPLGLDPEHAFWQGSADWTSKKAWSGQPFPIDKALESSR